MNRLPVVALVGRPNGGKSALFNRIVGERRVVVQETPGVTRDRIYAEADWNGRSFTLVDTGGMAGIDDPFAGLIEVQVEQALAEADVAVLVVDAITGPIPADADVAERLRRWGRPVLLCANKSESPKAPFYAFYELGLGEPLPVSALHGEGVGDLLDAVVERLPAPPRTASEEDDPARERLRVAIVGRPNVGKSSLVNRLLGSQRLITSEIAGTTRDAVDVPWGDFLLVDTPGLRRPARIEADLEHLSVARALRAAERAQAVVLVLDATELVTDQDKRIAGYVHDRGRAMVVVVNKTDLRPDLDLETVHAALPFLEYAPILGLSARSGRHVGRLAPVLRRVGQAHRTRVGTSELNRVIRDAVALHAAPAVKGRPFRLYYATQVTVAPPTFLCFANDPALVRPDYVRYLENRLRAVFDFTGTPIRLRFRARRRELRQAHR